MTLKGQKIDGFKLGAWDPPISGLEREQACNSTRCIVKGLRATESVIRLNTRLFRNCLDGVSDENAIVRPNGATNNLSFIACHLVDARHFMAGFLGLDASNPLADLLATARSVDDVPELPSMKRIRHAWDQVSRDLEACMNDLDFDDITAPSHHRFPVDDPSIGGAIAFLVQHESYHIGQLALLRKFLGYPAMTYR